MSYPLCLNIIHSFASIITSLPPFRGWGSFSLRSTCLCTFSFDHFHISSFFIYPFWIFSLPTTVYFVSIWCISSFVSHIALSWNNLFVCRSCLMDRMLVEGGKHVFHLLPCPQISSFSFPFSPGLPEPEHMCEFLPHFIYVFEVLYVPIKQETKRVKRFPRSRREGMFR